ncbi:MAG: ATP phosphoribosyltransferase regulatory subunit [Gammaproteobacteria bacterium]|jgi:ATP phosphoribosyltransferase regulatory subunit|nr:ATP phosphoribosyltransferase regulatory subunit [Gammaproteobacteria bacterium]
MTKKNRWLLPEGIEEILPPHAAQVESLCRSILDLFNVWGYELVMPPLIEYLDSLLTGTGEDLDLQTFKITDQLSGRSMGLRADMTPQVARIDAHILKSEFPTRLCYLGTVVHTRPGGHGGTRAPLQVGAELHGHAGVESDAEILCLMLKTLQLTGLNNIHVDLGHVGIYRGLVKDLNLSAEQESMLFDALQRKAKAELKEMLAEWSLSSDIAEMILSLNDLNGDISVLDEARHCLAAAGEEVLACIDELEKIAVLAIRQIKDAPLYFDLAELRGYHYYTGFTFAAYLPGQGQGIAFGGRYDDVGAAFGRARPATGFSTDVKTIFSLSKQPEKTSSAIFASYSEVPGLSEAVQRLREQGEIVIFELPGQTGTAKEMNCDRQLQLKEGKWQVVSL